METSRWYRRAPIALVSSLLLFAAAPLGAQTAPFPNKPIRIVVGFPPGGANDILARLLAAKM